MDFISDADMAKLTQAKDFISDEEMAKQSAPDFISDHEYNVSKISPWLAPTSRIPCLIFHKGRF